MTFRNLAILLIAIVFTTTVSAQEKAWTYRRPITNVQQEGWHSIQLPAEIFKHVSPSFDDLRILSIANDTVEIPYVLNIKETQVESESVSLSVMNESRKDGAYYITFLNSGRPINQIDLEFEEANYFATLRLEGSQNNKEWFTIVDEQKIFSVNNSFEQYSYNELHFPVSEYDYFRIAVTSPTALHFIRGSFQNFQEKPGSFVIANSRSVLKQDKRARQTIVELTIDHFQPISSITFDIPSQSDYYRSASIEVMTDSFKTEKGWVKNYQNVYNGYLTSIHPNQITFPYVAASQIRIIINNLDNAPLEIRDTEVKGPVVEIMASLNTNGAFLYYGKKDAYKPSYDIDHFRNKIPSAASKASLGPEEILIAAPEKVTAFFENKTLLYGVMIVIIAVLGFFTLRMMKTKPEA
jgi:hypothetical protein